MIKAKSMLQNDEFTINQQKKKFIMETSEQFDGNSICSELNLKVQDLDVRELMGNPTYRRLYNIVVYDTQKTEYEYRKNLIKELYFLLKITPIMKPELQGSYLSKLQKWYNKNDHKKTELGSGRLRNLIQQYTSTKQSFINHKDAFQNSRPQSGVNWNKNVPAFLRPYTAKRPNTGQNRPESYKSKFGQSTKASTRVQNSSQMEIRNFALSIREQFQMSQDFINKNRTVHPQSQPIYEQLFNIIKKADIGSKYARNQQLNVQNDIIFQRDKQQFFNSTENEVSKQSKDDTEGFKGDLDNTEDQQEEFEKVSEQSQKEDEEEIDKQEQIILDKKVYNRDLNIKYYDEKLIEGFMHLEHQNQYDTLLLKKLNNKYSHLTNNKLVNYSKDDHQMVRNYLNYSRVKSATKKQINRKSETIRLLSAKTRSSTNLTTINKTKNPRIYTTVPRRQLQSGYINSDKPESLNLNGAKFYDLSNFAENKQNLCTNFLSSPVYNQRKELFRLYQRPIEDYKKFSKKNITSVAEIKCQDPKLLTRYDCFLNRQKVDPIADIHVQKHNQETLSQIQKIKEKVGGLGKKWLSTDSLMKALYIDSYDDIGSSKTLNAEQKKMQAFDWKNRNIYFNMLFNGQKKMKKKTRKTKNK